MPDYRYILVDASSGTNIDEIPLTVSSFSRVLNGVGSLTGTIPLDHSKALPTSLRGDREITVLRDNAVVWNGPITVTDDGDLQSRTVTVTAREASWYLGKRTLEVNKNYNADVYYIVRNLIAYMTTKQGAGSTNINAALPRFFVSPATGTSGTTRAVHYYGGARHTIADIIDDLVADPTTGLDYRMDYATGSTRQQCKRTLTLGSPSLGVARAQLLTEHVLANYGKTEDRERAATRVHVIGSGYTSTAQNTGSVTNGDILIEAVTDRSDKSNHAFLDDFARDFRYRAQPPVSTQTVTYIPTVGGLEFGFADLGDTVNIQIGGATLLHSVAHSRVLQVEVTPSQGDTAESVALTIATPLDSLGT